MDRRGSVNLALVDFIFYSFLIHDAKSRKIEKISPYLSVVHTKRLSQPANLLNSKF